MEEISEPRGVIETDVMERALTQSRPPWDTEILTRFVLSASSLIRLSSAYLIALYYPR